MGDMRQNSISLTQRNKPSPFLSITSARECNLPHVPRKTTATMLRLEMISSKLYNKELLTTTSATETSKCTTCPLETTQSRSSTSERTLLSATTPSQPPPKTRLRLPTQSTSFLSHLPLTPVMSRSPMATVSRAPISRMPAKEAHRQD